MSVTADSGRFRDREIQAAVNRTLERPRRSRLPRIAGLLFGLLLVALVAAVGWLAWGRPPIALDRPNNGQPTIILEAADGTPISKSGGTWAGPVLREELPEHLVAAVLAIEDRRFFEHNGVDFLGIMRAAYRNYEAGDIVEGGSTVTQQLAKVLFLDREQTLRRKLQEAAIASWLELRLSKDEILTKYLDSIYFGAGATGISAAARVYFNKKVRDLSLAESAMLAGLIRAPSRLNPQTNLKQARERATLVLQAMVEHGAITREQALGAALNAAAPARGSAVPQTGSWFGDWVYNDAMQAMGPLIREARIRTTLQPKLQKLAEGVVRATLDKSGAAARAGQAALVAMTLDGAVVAMAGGRSYKESQFNRAANAERQPGSAFKTFVYLAALRSGRSPNDIVLDTPVEIDGWRPQNFSGRYLGEVTIEQAFARSLNAPTVRLAQEVGIDNVIAAARDLGIDAELEPNMSLALGTSEVNLLDLTGAYASIAAGRAPLQPWGIAGVSSDAGAEPTIFTEGPTQLQPLQERDAMVDLLGAVVSDGTGKRAALEGFTAGKTGTSQDYRDAWFIGFTDTLVVGVWVGNDDNAPMNKVTGGTLPAEIWRDFTAKAMGLAPAGAADEPVPEEPPAAEEQGDAAPFALDEPGEVPVAESVGDIEIAEEPPAEAEILIEEARAEPQSRLPRTRPEPAPRVEEAVQPRPRVVEQAAAPLPEVAPAPTRQRARVAARPPAAEPAPPAARQEAAPARADPAPRSVRRRPATAEPAPRRVERRQASTDTPLAQRRAEAEAYAAKRRAAAERRAGVDRPSILLGGRGLPGD